MDKRIEHCFKKRCSTCRGATYCHINIKYRFEVKRQLHEYNFSFIRLTTRQGVVGEFIFNKSFIEYHVDRILEDVNRFSWIKE